MQEIEIEFLEWVHPQLGVTPVQVEGGKPLVLKAKIKLPQRTWEGLSVFEINDLVENTEYEDYRDLIERTEAKLKGKNT